jgi:lysophospholipase L1-like esterase
VSIFLIFSFNIFGASYNIAVSMYNVNSTEMTNTISPSIKITNLGSEINLDEVKLRYYYTTDGDLSQNYWCDHASITNTNYTNVSDYIEGNFYEYEGEDTDNYLEISVVSNENIIGTGDVLSIQSRIAKDDWLSYNQYNDYSFNKESSEFVNWDKLTVYISDELVWGIEPSNSSSTTDTSTTTSTETETATATVTTTTTPTETITESPTNSIQKIACVGDSITAGYNATSYTVYLSELLGSNYNVGNYGVSGTTLLKNGDNPYWNQGTFTASQDWLPDVVLIMLGTNDSKFYNWLNKDEFVSDYTEMINIYKDLESEPLVYVMTSPTVFNDGNWGITNEVVTGEVVPLTIEVANANSCPIIDVNTATQGMGEYFTDNIHPNSKGGELIAEYIYETLN